MEWIGFWGSILGGLIGGIFTYLGVLATLKYQNKTKKEEDRKKEKELAEKRFDIRPRLEIVNCSGIKECSNLTKDKSDFSVILLKILNFERPNIFKYDKKALKMENLCYVEYTMKNIGKTEINDVGVTVNLPRNVALIEFDHKNFLIENEMLSYDGWIKKDFIKPGETFVLRIYYVKNQVMISNLGNPIITFWIEDTKHFLWEQALFAPDNSITDTRESSKEVLDACRDVGKALECFNNPDLW